MILFVAIQLTLAVALVVLGHWGRNNGHVLVPDSLPGEHRDARIRAIRRGATVCQVLGVLFALATIPALL